MLARTAARSSRMLLRVPAIQCSAGALVPARALLGSFQRVPLRPEEKRQRALFCTEVTVARKEVNRIMAAFEEARDSTPDKFEPSIGDDGVLWLDLGDKGWYSLQETDSQLLLFSPITGAIPALGARDISLCVAQLRRKHRSQVRCSTSTTPTTSGGSPRQMATCWSSSWCAS